VKSLFKITLFILFVWGVFLGAAWLIAQGGIAIIDALKANIH